MYKEGIFKCASGSGGLLGCIQKYIVRLVSENVFLKGKIAFRTLDALKVIPCSHREFPLSIYVILMGGVYERTRGDLQGLERRRGISHVFLTN